MGSRRNKRGFWHGLLDYNWIRIVWYFLSAFPGWVSTKFPLLFFCFLGSPQPLVCSCVLQLVCTLPIRPPTHLHAHSFMFMFMFMQDKTQTAWWMSILVTLSRTIAAPTIYLVYLTKLVIVESRYGDPEPLNMHVKKEMNICSEIPNPKLTMPEMCLSTQSPSIHWTWEGRKKKEKKKLRGMWTPHHYLHRHVYYLNGIFLGTYFDHGTL